MLKENQYNVSLHYIFAPISKTFSTIFKLGKFANTTCFNFKLPWCEQKTFTVHPNAKPSTLLNTMHSCIGKGTFRNTLFLNSRYLLKNMFQCSIIQLNITQVNEVSVFCKHKAK